MSTLECILIIILYIVMGICSWKSFYKISSNSIMDTIGWCMLWPIVWFVINIYAWVIGLIEFFSCYK